jgi:FKBP-type peptidyl-prolyl cis-trans isomerase 2
MSKSESVGPLKVITMQYSLTNADGVVVREATGTPVSYLHGAGLLFPKLESELETHVTGDIVTARLLPDDAFGKRNVELLRYHWMNCRTAMLFKLAAISLVFEVEIQGIRDATEEELRQRQVLV